MEALLAKYKVFVIMRNWCTFFFEPWYNVRFELQYKNNRYNLGQWRRRKLTSIGILTVIKTLIIPEINHLKLTLPNPGKDFSKNIHGKIHKVKKNIIIQEYRFRGLKMFNYFEFIPALKSSWVRRLIQCRTKWKNLIESIIN